MTITLSLTADQARVVRTALDLYSRICLGQFEEIAIMVRNGVVPICRDPAQPREVASKDMNEAIDVLVRSAKCILGYPRYGSNGIYHPHVDASGLYAYEVMENLEHLLAETD